jgi:hypothetical protein
MAHARETTVSELLDAFRLHYRQLEAQVREAVTASADTVVLWRLSDDHDEYTGLIHEVKTYAVLHIKYTDEPLSLAKSLILRRFKSSNTTLQSCRTTSDYSISRLLMNRIMDIQRL